MHCVRCGSVITGNDKFCPSCGNPLPVAAPAVAVVASPAGQAALQRQLMMIIAVLIGVVVLVSGALALSIWDASQRSKQAAPTGASLDTSDLISSMERAARADPQFAPKAMAALSRGAQSNPELQIRAKVSEVVLAASACRTTITEVYQSGGVRTMNANGWGCETSGPSSKYVESVSTTSAGKIIVTARGFGDSSIDGHTIELTPTTSSGQPFSTFAPGTVVGGWKCGPGSRNPIPVNYLPGSCRG